MERHPGHELLIELAYEGSISGGTHDRWGDAFFDRLFADGMVGQFHRYLITIGYDIDSYEGVQYRNGVGHQCRINVAR